MLKCIINEIKGNNLKKQRVLKSEGKKVCKLCNGEHDHTNSFSGPVLSGGHGKETFSK